MGSTTTEKQMKEMERQQRALDEEKKERDRELRKEKFELRRRMRFGSMSLLDDLSDLGAQTLG